MQNEVESAFGGDKYEITYLCDESNSIKDAVKVLEDNGAKISKETDLGIKKLAYPINKMTTAHYGVVLFEIEKTDLPRLEKALKLNKTVVRYLIVKELRTPIPKPVKEKAVEEEKPAKVAEKTVEPEKVKEKIKTPETVVEKVEPPMVSPSTPLGTGATESPVVSEVEPETKPAEEVVEEKPEEKPQTKTDMALKAEVKKEVPEVAKTKTQPQPKAEKSTRKKPAKAEFIKEELDKKLEELTLD